MSGIETAALFATFIVPETVRLVPASRVPSKFSVLPIVPEPLSLRFVFSATSIEPESVFPLAIFNSEFAVIFSLLIVAESLTAIPLPTLLTAKIFADCNVPFPFSLSRPSALFKTIPEKFSGNAIVPGPSRVN